MEKNITIATPTTLMMALKTISNVWDVERRNKNAELIADRAGKLYDKVSGFILNMEKVGERLAQAQDSYEVAFNQFSKGRGNVLSQVENLKTLGAKTSKSINTDFENTEEIEKSETDLDIR
jgi:DNA recombination protein RmuC